MTKVEATAALMEVFGEAAPNLTGPVAEQLVLLNHLGDMLVAAYESGRASGRAQGIDEI